MAAAMKTRKPSRRKRKSPSRAERLAAINEVCGKYAHVITSSDEFARRKQEEIEIENRRR